MNDRPLLNEIAESAGVTMSIDEGLIPVRDDVRGACEILGFDPLYVANEGRCVAFVAPADVEPALGIMRFHDVSLGARRIGSVGRLTSDHAAAVTMRSAIGANRVLDMLSGEQLPRIC